MKKTYTTILATSLLVVSANAAVTVALTSSGTGTDVLTSGAGFIDTVNMLNTGSTGGQTLSQSGTNINISTTSITTGTLSTGGASDTFYQLDGAGEKWEYQNNNGVGEGWDFNVTGLAAGTYELDIYASKWNAEAELTATVGADSDTGAWTTGNIGGNRATDKGLFTVTFDVTSSSDLLEIDYLITENGASSSSDNVAIYQMTLTPLTQIPEPSSAALLGLGGLALVARRKRS